MPQPSGNPLEVTQLLLEWGQGNSQALEEMVPLVYDELRRLAGYYMQAERRDHTLQPTALVHEAFLRLIDQRKVDWSNRAQFLGLAAEMMRRVLLNHARDAAAGKRGGGAKAVTLSAAESFGLKPDLDLIALDHSLEELGKIDPRKCRVVELKFFGGLTAEEISAVMGISVATIEREWKFARAWLFAALSEG